MLCGAGPFSRPRLIRREHSPPPTIRAVLPLRALRVPPPICHLPYAICSFAICYVALCPGPPSAAIGGCWVRNGRRAQAHARCARAHGRCAQAHGPCARAHGRCSSSFGRCAQAHDGCAQAHGSCCSMHARRAQAHGRCAQAHDERARRRVKVRPRFSWPRGPFARRTSPITALTPALPDRPPRAHPDNSSLPRAPRGEAAESPRPDGGYSFAICPLLMCHLPLVPALCSPPPPPPPFPPPCARAFLS